MSKSKIRDKILRTVRDTLRRVGVTTGARLVVAVSGGPDSLALLYALHELASEIGVALHGAHLNHNLRGADSDADAAFVQQTFRSLDIPCTVEEADVSAFRAAQKISLEDAARRLRYDFFARVVNQQSADCVALGHTSDDQAETVLLHLIRGSGLAGLRGMDYRSEVEYSGQRMSLLRPLLGISRQETTEFCRALKLQPRLDASNLSTEFSRNRVRLEILPQMEVINPAVKDSLVRLSHSVARDYSYLQSEVESVLDSVIGFHNGIVQIDRTTFADLAPAIQHHLIRRAVLMAKSDLIDLTQYHVEEMVRLMSGQPGKFLSLPGGLQFLVSYDVAFISLNDQAPCPLPELTGRTRLQVPGETRIGNWLVKTSIVEHGGSERQSSPRMQSVDSRLKYTERFAVLDDELLVRTREAGDRFQPLGMSGAKKLQDFMVDAKIPRHWRDRVPLVVTPKGIAWVMGWRIADWARVRDDTRQALEIEFRP
ncbi:MAG: tRNA lysidine(34) synthetase TilS, partial [Chloroflexi bacterium]|nr:tRNA lysidine(34) synthetase TilS [Chloroflexota bacterium]